MKTIYKYYTKYICKNKIIIVLIFQYFNFIYENFIKNNNNSKKK